MIREPKVLANGELLPSVNNLANKWWAIPVPAAAVTPEPRVAITIIGSKGSVAGLLNSL